MATAPQIAANQQNSKLSTGPTSGDGKSNSSINALRHGFTGQLVIVLEHEAQIYQEHCDAYHLDLAPVGKIETDITQELADLRWSINRIRAHETNLFTVQSYTQQLPFETGDPNIDSVVAIAASLGETSRTLVRLSIYENRKTRTYEKSFNTLRGLQKERRVREAAQELSESAQETAQPIPTKQSQPELASFVHAAGSTFPTVPVLSLVDPCTGLPPAENT